MSIFEMITSTTRPLFSIQRPRSHRNAWTRQERGSGEVWRIRSTQDLQVAEKRLENCRVELTLTVSPESTRKNFDAFVQRYEQRNQVPGFRRGQKVPLPILMRHCGGQEAFHGELLQQIVEMSTEKALGKWEDVAIAESHRLESNMKELLKNFDPDEEIQFNISFDVLSEVKWTSPYKDIKLEVKEIGNEETDKANVEIYIREFLKKSGTQRIVQGRGLDNGDVAIMDFEFVRPDNREPLPSLKQDKFRFDTDLPDALGIIDKLKGMRPGDVRETEIVFPEDWEPSTYRGVETLAIVKCRELFEWDLPELTDEIIRGLKSSSLQTVSDLRDSLQKAEMGRRAERLKDRIQDALLDELANIVDMEVSEFALKETAKVRYEKTLLEYQAQGKIGPDALKQMTTETMLHNYMISHKAEIEKDQKATAAMDAIAKELKMQVTKEELDGEVEAAEKEFKDMKKEYDVDRLREIARDVLMNMKVVEWFVSNENIQVVPYDS